MKIISTEIEGLSIIQPKIFEDSRGYFFESYNKLNLKGHHINIDFVQDNQSKSSYGVIRGLHYQLNPYSQTKLIRVLQGAILDVVVDIRKGSPTFGKHLSVELTDKNKKQLLIPRGFAHGFSVLSETAVVFYKCDEYYHPASDRGIFYNDPGLGIDWRIEEGKTIVSDKDLKHPKLKDAEINFVF